MRFRVEIQRFALVSYPVAFIVHRKTLVKYINPKHINFQKKAKKRESTFMNFPFFKSFKALRASFKFQVSRFKNPLKSLKSLILLPSPFGEGLGVRLFHS